MRNIYYHQLSSPIMKVFYHEKYLEHVLHPEHPECPERLIGIMDFLKTHHIETDISEPKTCTEKEAIRVHTKEYFEYIRTLDSGWVDVDTPIHPLTVEIALLSAGGAKSAALWSFENKRPAIALIRPPGHHAGRFFGGGFCYFNNIAIATQTIIDKYNVKKIMILDFDVHHGNGTQDIFYQRNDVLFLSTHLYPHYPGTGAIHETGEGSGEGFTINLPLPHGSGDSTFEMIFEKIIYPVTDEYCPEMFLISLGVDAHYMDPLGGLTLSSNGYYALVASSIKLANKYCENRIAITLEGGYSIPALAEVVGTVISEGKTKNVLKYIEKLDTDCIGKAVIEESIKTLKKYWKIE